MNKAMRLRNAGKTYKEIAHALDVPLPTIWIWLRIAGTSGRATSRNILADPRRVKLRERIVKLRKERLSYRKIAAKVGLSTETIRKIVAASR